MFASEGRKGRERWKPCKVGNSYVRAFNAVIELVRHVIELPRRGGRIRVVVVESTSWLSNPRCGCRIHVVVVESASWWSNPRRLAFIVESVAL